MTPDQQYNRSVLRYGPPDAEIVRADGTTTTKSVYEQCAAYIKTDHRSGYIEASGVEFDRKGQIIGPEGVRIVNINADADGTTTTSRMLTRDELASVGITPRYADLRTGGMLPPKRTHALRAFLVVLAVMVVGAFIVSAMARAAHDAAAVDVGVEGIE